MWQSIDIKSVGVRLLSIFLSVVLFPSSESRNSIRLGAKHSSLGLLSVIWAVHHPNSPLQHFSQFKLQVLFLFHLRYHGAQGWTVATFFLLLSDSRSMLVIRLLQSCEKIVEEIKVTVRVTTLCKLSLFSNEWVSMACFIFLILVRKCTPNSGNF